MRYVSGWNVSGFMPDAEPQEHSTFDEAKAALLWEVERWGEPEGAPGYWDTLTAAIDAQTAPFNLLGPDGQRYWVEVAS